MLDLISAFETYIVGVKQVSANTRESYMRDIRQLDAWLADNEGRNLTDATYEDVAAFVDYLEEEGRANPSICRLISSVKCLFDYAVTAGFREENPISGMKYQREKRKLPQILSSAEIERLLAQPACIDAKGYRDKAILEVMYATGIRVSELVGLNVDDVNLKGGFLRCQVGTKRPRYIPMYPAAVRHLSNYIKRARPGMLCDPMEPALFVNLDGRRISRQGLWKLLRDYQQDAGIDKVVTPHTLRHSFAVHLLENGADMESIQELMGHCDISSTHMYSQLAKQDLQNVYKKCHPKAQ